MEHVVLGISGLFLFVAFCTIHGVAANLSPEDIQEERERERERERDHVYLKLTCGHRLESLRFSIALHLNIRGTLF